MADNYRTIKLGNLTPDRLASSPFPGRKLTLVDVTIGYDGRSFLASHRKSAGRVFVSTEDGDLNTLNRLVGQIESITGFKWDGHAYYSVLRGKPSLHDELKWPWLLPFNNRVLGNVAEVYRSRFGDVSIEQAVYEEVSQSFIDRINATRSLAITA